MNFPRHTTALLAILFLAVSFTACSGCGDGSGDGSGAASDADSTLVDLTTDIPMKEIVASNGRTYNVADITDEMTVYKEQVDRSRCLFVISKKEYRLYVYEVVDADTLLVAHFPVCYARNAEAKTASGDMCTPECTIDNPFRISQIQDASTWCHDFGDGRGSILSYGAWFLRLETPGFSGVGIHGSTNNAESVPGRDSEGCIRLRDADLLTLHDLYAEVGVPVVIKSISMDKFPFEQHAQDALGEQYKAAKRGRQTADATASDAPSAGMATPSVDEAQRERKAEAARRGISASPTVE